MFSPLYFAKKAEARKYTRYLATARAMNHLFHPYAVETFGSSGPMLDETLKALADRFRNMTTLVSNSEVSKKSQLVRYWRVKISAALQRETQGLSSLKPIASDVDHTKVLLTLVRISSRKFGDSHNPPPFVIDIYI